MSEATFIYAFIVDRRDTFQQVDSQRRGVSGIITQPADKLDLFDS